MSSVIEFCMPKLKGNLCAPSWFLGDGKLPFIGNGISYRRYHLCHHQLLRTEAVLIIPLPMQQTTHEQAFLDISW